MTLISQKDPTRPTHLPGYPEPGNEDIGPKNPEEEVETMTPAEIVGQIIHYLKNGFHTDRSNNHLSIRQNEDLINGFCGLRSRLIGQQLLLGWGLYLGS